MKPAASSYIRFLSWRFLLECVFRRLAKRPYWIEPPGAARYRAVHATDYEKFFAEAKASRLRPQLNMDYTGAGDTDYLLLDRYIAAKRPARILELGSGVTTYVMANALQRLEQKTGQRGHVVSVDHIAAYSEGTHAMLTPELRGYVTFVVSPTTYDTVYGGVSAMSYRDIPSGDYDFIYVDGPSTAVGKEMFPSIDALLHLRSGGMPVKGTDVLIDKRFPTLSYSSLWLDKPVYYDPCLGVGWIENATAGNVLASPNSWRRPRVQIANVLPRLL